MSTIQAVLTEDFHRYFPQYLGSVGAIVPAESQSSYTTLGVSTPVVPLSSLSAGDLFYHSSVLKRLLSIPTALGLTAGFSWVETVSSGVVNQLSDGTVVTRQRAYNLIPAIKSFKIGEGGWIDLGAGKVPRQPDPTLRRLDNNIQDLDSVVDNTRVGLDIRYPISSRGSYEKDLNAGSPDFTFAAPNVLRIRCRLETTEFNDDGFGNNPSLWEIGIFTEHPTVIGERLMIAYGTFPEQIKTNVQVIENYVEIRSV